MPRRKNTENLHRLSKSDEDAIYALVEKRIKSQPGDNATERKDKERRQEALEQFRIKITPVYRGSPRAKGPLRLCYEHIPQLLEISGLTYLDIFKAIAKDPNGNPYTPRWATDDETQMCSYCDLLSTEQRIMAKELIRALLPDTFESLDEQHFSPVQKIAKANYMRTYCSNETARQAVELGVVKQYRRRNIPYSYNAIEFSLLPFMAENFDISLHWLLDLDEKHCVFAANGETESLMTLFCFLPDERKILVLKAVETALMTGGAL